MKYISLSVDSKRKLPFYLAMEEYVAKYLNLDEAFFMWQVKPTVIFGRNQLVEKEVNLDYCAAHGIEMYRRKSGGGCVYADMGNVMFSYITCDYNVSNAYGKYVDKVVTALNALNVNAVSNGRNDIVIDGRKISGNAFYHVNGKSVVHGTMLYDTDMENMINAITPSSVKLSSNGVESVRSRITTLNKYMDMPQDDFKKYVKERVCEGEFMLDTSAIKVIEEIEESYYNEKFLYGKNPRYSIEKEAHIEGVGLLCVKIKVNRGVIKDICFSGDFFSSGDICKTLTDILKDVPFTEDCIRNALAGINMSNMIMNLNNEQFINLIIKE